MSRMRDEFLDESLFLISIRFAKSSLLGYYNTARPHMPAAYADHLIVAG